MYYMNIEEEVKIETESEPEINTSLSTKTNLYNSFIISENNMTILDELLKNNCNIEQYDFIYVSYGSKKNLFTKDIIYSNTGLRTLEFNDNSIYQITPIFLFLFYQNAKILCITIDVYNEIEQIEKSFDILSLYYSRENSEKEPDVYNKIDVIFYDIIPNKENIIDITNYLKSLFIEKEIIKEKFLFCNFIRFKQPNSLESNIENDVPILIYDILKTNYPDSFYQWCGYNSSINMMTYNLIYNYKNTNILFGFNNINMLLNNLQSKINLTEYNYIHNVNNYLLKNDHLLEKDKKTLTIFFNSILNIKEIDEQTIYNFSEKYISNTQSAGKNKKQTKKKKTKKKKTKKKKRTKRTKKKIKTNKL